MENAHLALEQAKEELTYLYTFFARAYINNIIKRGVSSQHDRVKTLACPLLVLQEGDRA